MDFQRTCFWFSGKFFDCYEMSLKCSCPRHFPRIIKIAILGLHLRWLETNGSTWNVNVFSSESLFWCYTLQDSAKNIMVTILLFKIQYAPILYVTLWQKRRFGNYWSLPPEMSTFFHFETLDALCLNAWEQETTRSPSFLKRYKRRFRKRAGKKHHVSSGCMAHGDQRSDTALI